jgi:hypothetical protein
MKHASQLLVLFSSKSIYFTVKQCLFTIHRAVACWELLCSSLLNPGHDRGGLGASPQPTTAWLWVQESKESISLVLQ